jgi:hypothetical protein
MPTPGLVFVRTRITSPDLSDETFNTWYNQVHIPDALHAGLGELALRYKNLEADGKYQYCTLYKTSDIENANPATSAKIPHKSELLPGTGSWKDLTEMLICRFELIQRFEGQGHFTGRGDTLLTVAMEPADDADFDEWYRKQVSGPFRIHEHFADRDVQHLDMLSLGTGYIRSTRYKLVAGDSASVPRFLTLHEYETTDFPDTTLVRGTEWSKRMLSTAKAFERGAWKLVFQSGEEKL